MKSLRLVAAKCPNCGASIDVSPDTETTRCKTCGSDILVDEAIQKLNLELSGSVVVDSNIETMLKSADGFISLKRWLDAEKLFTKIVEINSVDYRAWWGLVRVHTKDFSDYHNKSHYEYFESAIKLVDNVTKDKLLAVYQPYKKTSQEIRDFARSQGFSEGIVYFDRASQRIAINSSKKSKTVALLLCIFIGYYGIHKFYVGKLGTGIIWMFTCGCFIFDWLYDIVSIARGNFTDGYGLTILNW